MSKRVLVMVVACALLAAAGALLYVYSTPKTTMAAECDDPASAPATPDGAGS